MAECAVCHTIDHELVIAWTQDRGKHLRCLDNTGCLCRLLRASNVIRLHGRTPDYSEAA